MPFVDLPARGERSAPAFDDHQPEELGRYFEDLESLLTRHNVTDEQEMKRAAVRYLRIRTESLWKTTIAWNDLTKTFDEFKDEVFKLYPGSSGDRTYSIQDLDLLIGHFSRVGIRTSAELGEYHRQFLLISRYLIAKGRLAETEQSRMFFRGLQPDLEQRTRQRLQQKYIDKYPDDPHDLSVIFEAVTYVLIGTSSTQMAQASPQAQRAPNPSTTSSGGSTSSADTKIEALAAVVASLGEMVKTVLQTQAGAPPRSTGAAAQVTSAPSGQGSSACNFCGVTGHFIRECEVVADYIKAGKCKRSADSRVVLPSGASVSRGTPGTWLRDRIDEWHRINPGQMAAAMLFEVTAASAATALQDQAAGQSFFSRPVRCATQRSGVDLAKAFALNRPPRPRPEVVIDSQPPRHRGRAGQGEGLGGAGGETAPQVQQKDAPPHLSQDPSAAKKGANSGTNRGVTQEPTHPYAAIPDATNGSVSGQVRSAAREPAAGKDQAYTTSAKIHDPRIAKAVYERAMETPITVTHRELLSLAPEVRAQVSEVTTKKRVPRAPAPVLQAMIEEIEDEDSGIGGGTSNSDAEVDNPPPIPRSVRIAQATHMPAAYVAAARTLPADATVIADPYETYLREHAPVADSADFGIIVAGESNALRAIMPIVDGQDRVEAILDPGCQIVAMSEEVSNALALSYDPTIRLHMVSANGGVDQSLGLARNVPFLVGDITLYLQVHVLRAPAYDILLGRPFDVLTQSVVRNFSDENQTITIIDPNTDKRATVPTIPRGTFRFSERRAHKYKCPVHSQDF